MNLTLDKTTSPSQQAQKYFKEYRRWQRAAKALGEPITKAEAALAFINDIIFSAENAQEAEELEELRRLWLEEKHLLGGNHRQDVAKERRRIQAPSLGPRRYRFNDFLILVGRNPRQNDYVSMRASAEGDLWFHARNLPGAHVLIKAAGRHIDPATIAVAAYLAAKHSKGLHSTHLEVMCAPAKNVRKPKGSLPGRVFVKGESTINVSPQELPLGLQEENSRNAKD